MFDPDLKAVPVAGKFFSLDPDKEKELQLIGSLASYAKEIEERVYLTHRQKSEMAFIKGVDSSYQKTIDVR